VIAAVAAGLALAAPSRDALIERWRSANTTHTVARLNAGPPATSNAPAPDLRSLATRELATPGRYLLGKRPAPAKPWWAPLWDWVAERWQQFWRGLFERAHVGKTTAASIGDVLLAVVALVLVVTIVRLLRNIQIARTAAQNGRPEALAEAVPPSELYGDACAAAGRGDYGAAALLLFAATVTLLDGRGAVIASRTATVGDLRRQLRARNAVLVGPFDAVAAAFVQRAYAERAVAEPQWNSARYAYEQLAVSS
jgi:hypothetical protein